MKKRIAVFANGWNSENLSNFMVGVEKSVKPDSMDFFVFLSFASYGYNEINRKAEALVYDLPDLSSFDGIIIFGPGLNFQEVIENIQKKADESGLPVISIGLKHPGHYYLRSDNYVGMKDLVDHMIEKHGCRKLFYVAGSRENEDSNIRKQAILDSAKEHNIPFSEDDVFYSEWEPGRALDYIRMRYKSPEEFPDAFLCANDPLSISISQLMEVDYHLDPQTVRITGFDHLDSAKTYYPAISTVDQGLDQMGKKAAEVFEKIFDGKKIKKEYIIPCKFSVGESCGCRCNRAAIQERRQYVRKLQFESRIHANKEGRLFYIERCIFQAQDFEHAKKSMRDLVYNHGGLEGSTFYIMFSPVLTNIGDKEESLLPKFKLDDEYFILCGKKDGVPVKAEKVCRKDIVPDYSREGANKIYLVTSLQYEGLMCGYFVSGTDAYSIRESDFSNYQSRIDRAFFPYIKNSQINTLNKKLEDLMEQDSLTHVKNRTAYDKYVKYFQESVIRGERTEYAIVYCDVNNLKVVNDKYGHEAGDAYIRNSCKMICDTFKHSPVFRIGGDEFLSILINDDYKNRDRLLSEMKEEMKNREEKPDKYSPAARVSIACGMAVFEPEKDKDVMMVVNKADVLMYEEKARMKKGNIR